MKVKDPFTPSGELWILSANGTPYWPTDPRNDNVDISVIAQSLAQKVRFGGHGRPFYSVAQHSVLVSNIAESLTDLPYLRFQAGRLGQMHDAHEAWLVDLPSPLKKQPAIRDWWHQVEAMWDKVIFDVLDIEDRPELRQLVRLADRAALRLEGKFIMPTPPGDWNWPGHGADADEVIALAERVRMIDASPLRGVWTWERAEEKFLDKWFAYEEVLRAR